MKHSPLTSLVQGTQLTLLSSAVVVKVSMHNVRLYSHTVFCAKTLVLVYNSDNF